MYYELVKVIDSTMLLDPVQLQCRAYRTHDGRRLARGIYAVVWPPEIRQHAFDVGARFFGPFSAWRQARDFVTGTLASPN
jgi:hypothetical protein